MTANLLLQIYHQLQFNQINDYVFWSLFLMAFFTMSRKLNLVVTSLRERVRCLTRNDVIWQHSLLVIFKWSKTNQFGNRVHKISLTELKGSPLCPVMAYKNMCAKLPVTVHRPAFSGDSPIYLSWLAIILKGTGSQSRPKSPLLLFTQFSKGSTLSCIQGRGSTPI